MLHKLINYVPQRRAQRERWLSAMQSSSVPMRVIDGEADPVSGSHMVSYRQLIAKPDSVLLPGIGHYPQIEAPAQVLRHYPAFREQLAPPSLKSPVLIGVDVAGIAVSGNHPPTLLPTHSGATQLIVGPRPLPDTEATVLGLLELGNE